jgi:hypothetical protein
VSKLRTALTDIQLWTLINTADGIADADLAATLDARITTIHAARWRLRRTGWTCAVSYGTCQVCGGTFTRQGHQAGRRAYHPACRPEALKQLNAGYDAERWELLSPQERRSRLDRAHQYVSDHQEQSVPTATRHGARWQDWEDAVIRDGFGRTDLALAQELGRTLYAIRARKRLLRSEDA